LTAISDVARLRPDWVEIDENADDIQSSFGEVVREQGIEPALVASQVVEAVRARRFWVLTHDVTVPIALLRSEDLKADRNPSPNPGDLARMNFEALVNPSDG
jgi:hypothetical protein